MIPWQGFISPQLTGHLGLTQLSGRKVLPTSIYLGLWHSGVDFYGQSGPYLGCCCIYVPEKSYFCKGNFLQTYQKELCSFVNCFALFVSG